MSAVQQRSNYGKQGSGGDMKKQGSATDTTHYAYRLIKQEDGSFTKEYVNSVLCYEKPTQYGSLLKVVVTGPIPLGDVYFAAKRPKS